MKILSLIKDLLRAASYGISVAIVLLLLFPNLRIGGQSFNQIFSISAQTDAPMSYASAVQVASPAVVNIYSEDIATSNNYNYNYRQRNTLRLGSGVIMQADGYILTNYHVVQNAAQIAVWLQSGQRYPGEVIGYDVYTDLAVLKVNAEDLPVIPQQANYQPHVGDVVLAIGNPLNLGQTVTQGIISATGRSGLSNTSYLQFLQMDAAINAGNSGGALVNSNGTLVGINSVKFTELNPNLDIQGISFAIPYKLAAKVMQQIIENGRVIRGWLGISANTYLTNIKGFVIDQVIANSPADKAGLQPGDVVTQIGNTRINSITQALDIVAETTPNTQLQFTIYRNKQQLKLPVIIQEIR